VNSESSVDIYFAQKLPQKRLADCGYEERLEYGVSGKVMLGRKQNEDCYD
jgi:hypothetical protein